MTLKLSEFNLKSYKEREVILMALTYYSSHRAEDAKLFGHTEELEALQQRIASVQCQPGGCEYCSNVEGD